jgi:hypothetical protein
MGYLIVTRPALLLRARDGEAALAAASARCGR